MERSDVFISYRRKDRGFVRRLYEAFVAGGREVWIDWEDIPPGSVDFTDDIRRGIDGADAFVAVLSPPYLQSAYCLGELAYAAGQGKRLVPIVLETFDDQGVAVPESIAQINWVYFCPYVGEANEFEDAFPRLLAALDVDQAHVREHTRLYLRAREWESRGREQSFLLTGAEVTEAEMWLARGVNKQPPPTDLHSEYILASREAENAHLAYERKLQRQARDRLRLLIALLVVGVVLALASFVGFDSAMYRAVRQLSTDSLRSVTEFAASGIDGDQLVALVRQATPNAEGTTDDSRYWALRGWFERLRQLDDRLWPYTFVQGSAPGEVVFVADSFAALYPGRSIGFLEAFYRPDLEPEALLSAYGGTFVSEEPVTDAWGTWVSAYSPIHDASGRTVGVLGIDMQIDDYLALSNQVQQTFMIVVVVLAVAGVAGVTVFAAYRWRQRQAMGGG